MSSGIITGPLFDRGFIRPLVSAGSLLIIVGMLATSFASSYTQLFLAQGVCVGLGFGATYVPGLAAVSAAFTHKPQQRPIAIGISSVGSSLGGIVLPIMLRSLISRISFAWAVRALALTNLAAAFAIVAVLCRHPGRANRKGTSFFDKSALRDLAFLFFALSLFITYLPYYIPLTYITTFARTALNANQDYAGYLLAIVMAGGLLGRTLPFLPLRPRGLFKSARVLVCWTIVCALLFFAWIGVRSVAGFTAWCVAWGLASGALVVAPTSTLVHPALASRDEGVLGARMGIAWTAAALGELVGPPIFGAVADVETGYYLPGLVFGGCVMLLGAVCLCGGPMRAIRRYDREEADGVLATEDTLSSDATLEQTSRDGAVEENRSEKVG